MSKYIGTPVVNLSVDTVDVTGDITATDATPEVIIVNDTHEDTDGGREGKVTFKGQQSGGEETTLAQIQASHDGTSDDEKGDLIFKTNDGSDGASPTEAMRINSDGNVGIGTATIPAADAAYVTVGTNDYAISHNGFSNNSFFDGSSYKARRAASGHILQMGDDLNLYNAASVSAGAAQSLVENFRITQGGALKAMSGGTSPVAGVMHSFTTNAANTYTLMVRDFNSSPASQYLVELQFNGASPDGSSAKFLQCRDSTTARLNINSDGDVQNHDNSYGAISDEKLKEQISDASEQWDDVKALRIRKFKFKTDVATGDSDNHWRLGVVAQEVEASGMNKLIKEEADVEVDDEGVITETGTTTKTVKYSILYMKAVKALQEAMARIETLETKVAALEGE